MRGGIESALGCKLLRVEGNPDPAQRGLDMLGGIDYLCAFENGIRGLASRVQHGRSWQTFTVRARRCSGAATEYEKRVYGMQNGFIYPYYTLQAYIDGDMCELAVCHTEDLMRAVSEGRCTRRRTDNAEFYVVKWGDVRTVRSRFNIRHGAAPFL